MPTILEQIAKFGTDLDTNIPKTYGAILPHLKKNAQAINSTPRSTASYGPHERHKLDIYTPANSSGSEPIIVYLPGGGLTQGDRLMAGRCENLVWANIGHYFTTKGFTTVVADYRRVGEDKEQAKYPSGGEDVKHVLTYLDSLGQKRSVIVIGHSAGGVHLSTYLFSPAIARPEYENIKLVGAVLLCVAFDFAVNVDRKRVPVLQDYFGKETLEEIDEHSAVGNINAISAASKAQQEQGKVLNDGVKIYLVDCELDPPEITGPKERFIKAHKIARMYRDAHGDGDKRERNREEMTVRVIEGHNHVSPSLSLSSGDKEAEKWAEDVLEWIGKITTV